jgi:hypothetical protein
VMSKFARRLGEPGVFEWGERASDEREIPRTAAMSANPTAV